jgi:uncharacterized protein YbjT (DUF2867 family)
MEQGSAFVAGATGYTGREVVRALRARGIDTIAHVRADSTRQDEWRARFASLGARTNSTPWRPEPLEALLAREQPSWVFALLGTTQARARQARREGKPDSYETVDYQLTALLLDATKLAAPKARFLYLSSIGVNRDTRNPYLAVRARIEEELTRSGIAWTIARPSFITGPDRDEGRPLERVAALVSDTVLDIAAVLGAKRLRAHYASTTNRVLADTLVRLALDDDAANRVFESEQLRTPG